MARPSILNVRSLPDFVTLYNWNVTLTKTPSGASAPTNLNFQCLTSSIPKASNELIEINVRGHKVSQPGIQSYDGTLNLQIVETNDAAVIKFVESWRELQWKTEEGTQTLRSSTEANFQLQLLNRQDAIIRTYELIGCYLQDYELGELGGESQAIQPTLTIKYDYFKSS